MGEQTATRVAQRGPSKTRSFFEGVGSAIAVYQASSNQHRWSLRLKTPLKRHPFGKLAKPSTIGYRLDQLSLLGDFTKAMKQLQESLPPNEQRTFSEIQRSQRTESGSVSDPSGQLHLFGESNSKSSDE